MELKGKVIQVLEEQTGQGKNGQWRKNKFVIEIPGQYPKNVAIDVWGDKFDQMPIKVGNEVNAFIDVESREWKGNWYTDVKAWKVEAVQQNSAQNQVETNTSNNDTPPFQSNNIPAGKEPDYSDDDFDDELPF